MVALPRVRAHGAPDGRLSMKKELRRSWVTRTICLRLPVALAQAMWQRARQWDTRVGGRFSAHARLILVWSGVVRGRATHVPPSEPQGAISVTWPAAAGQQATIDQIAWDPAAGGDEALVARAANVLAGQQVIVP